MSCGLLIRIRCIPKILDILFYNLALPKINCIIKLFGFIFFCQVNDYGVFFRKNKLVQG